MFLLRRSPSVVVIASQRLKSTISFILKEKDTDEDSVVLLSWVSEFELTGPSQFRPYQLRASGMSFGSFVDTIF